MLNADWHHGDEDPQSSVSTAPHRLVLNADWHHGDEDCQCREDLQKETPVLNADWHHGDEDIPGKCRRVRTLCAQRRLASRGRGHRRSTVPEGSQECSTPIGITGTRTMEDGRQNVHYSACSTPIGITGTRTIGFQCCNSIFHCVLNADWHHGDEDDEDHQDQKKEVTGAQRRLASRGRGPHRPPDRRSIARVLNADWHHGDEDR